MLFKRRHKEPATAKIRNWIWPRIGFNRAYDYWKHRLGRMHGTSHSIAAGLASGAALSCTPFLGIHILLSWVLCFIVRGNYIAAAIGTAMGNPWTFPIFFTITYNTGAWVLGTETTGEIPTFSWAMLTDHFTDTFQSILLPMIIGAIPLGLVMWLVIYFPVRSFLTRYKARRLARKAKKRQSRVRRAE